MLTKGRHTMMFGQIRRKFPLMLSTQDFINHRESLPRSKQNNYGMMLTLSQVMTLFALPARSQLFPMLQEVGRGHLIQRNSWKKSKWIQYQTQNLLACQQRQDSSFSSYFVIGILGFLEFAA